MLPALLEDPDESDDGQPLVFPGGGTAAELCDGVRHRDPYGGLRCGERSCEEFAAVVTGDVNQQSSVFTVVRKPQPNLRAGEHVVRPPPVHRLARVAGKLTVVPLLAVVMPESPAGPSDQIMQRLNGTEEEFFLPGLLHAGRDYDVAVAPALERPQRH